MVTEVLNFIDGQRRYYDVYKVTYTEVQAAGSCYYGTVVLNDFSDLLDAGVKVRVLTLK